MRTKLPTVVTFNQGLTDQLTSRLQQALNESESSYMDRHKDTQETWDEYVLERLAL